MTKRARGLASLEQGLGELARVCGCGVEALAQGPETNTVLEVGSWEVERRGDGAVLVRVHSRPNNGNALPDAVFAFRAGDPQYSYWEQQLLHKQRSAG